MQFENDFEDDFEMENDPFLGDIVGGIGSVLGSLGFEDSFEDTFEGDGFENDGFESDAFETDAFEAELFEDGAIGEAAEAAALMEVLADHVAEADSSAEADEFLPILGALAPLAMKALPAAAKLAPKVLSLGRRVVPQLARGVVRVGRQLARSPAGRQAIRALPRIARRTAADVLRDVGRGRPLTARGVTQALARNTSYILRHPHRRRHAIHHNHRIARYSRGAIAAPVAGGVARPLGSVAGGASAGGMTPVYGRGGMIPYRRGRWGRGGGRSCCCCY
jgi:hypothetical protein